MLSSLPLSRWLKNYDRYLFSQDFIAGIITAITLVPQSMAYALLAGVPAVYGLYGAIVPTLLYSLLGSSRHISIAPAALISIMVASTVGGLNPESEQQYVYYTVVTAFLTGIFLIVMRLLRLGNITQYISTPVVNGFTSAAAIIIAASQIKYIVGISVPNGLSFLETVQFFAKNLGQTNIGVLILGICCFLLLWFFKKPWASLMDAVFSNKLLLQVLKKSGPLIVIILVSLVVQFSRLDVAHSIPVVGKIPQGFPKWIWFDLNIEVVKTLAFPSFLIALMCFLTSTLVGNSLAAKRREKLDPDQELLAIGVANLSASFFSSFSVAASMSRTAVSYKAGAQTSVMGMIAAIGVLMTLLWLTPLFYFLPLAMLGSIVIMSVFSMMEIDQIKHYWQVNRADAISFITTFFMVLLFGIEIGLGVGILYSVVLLIQRTSHPHIAVVGRVGKSEHFRNINRHKVETKDTILSIRVDENLHFANSDYVQNHILDKCAQNKSLRHVVLICSSISFVDVNAIDMFYSLIEKLKESDIVLHLAEVKGPVMDQIKKTDLLKTMEPGQVFLSTDLAVSFCEKGCS